MAVINKELVLGNRTKVPFSGHFERFHIFHGERANHIVNEKSRCQLCYVRNNNLSLSRAPWEISSYLMHSKVPLTLACMQWLVTKLVERVWRVARVIPVMMQLFSLVLLRDDMVKCCWV